MKSAHDGRIESYGYEARPMAVLVQRMVEAEVSGVAFSANPLTGNRDEVRVSVTRGLGDQLVSGGIDADEWVGAGSLETMPARWTSDDRPRLQREIEQHAAVDLVSLDDAALFLHLEDLKAFYARCLQLHFTLFIPHTVGLYELAIACEELLGWDLQKTMGLLQGLSNASTASTDALAALARRAGQCSATRHLLQSRTPDILKRLAETDPPVAEELRQYLQFWGLRPIGPEAGCPTVADQPPTPNASIRFGKTTCCSPISFRPAFFDESPSKRGGDSSAWGSWDAPTPR